ncbi:MAG: hypothetical protein RR060_06910 [Victivallaceae bacterium]
MRIIKLLLILLIGWAPFFIEFHQLLASYKNSALERYNWVYLLIFMIFYLPLLIRNFLQKPVKVYLPAIILVLLSGGIIILGFEKNIHALTGAGTICFAWSIHALMLGENFAVRSGAPFAVALLTTPSLGYHAAILFDCNAAWIRPILLLLLLFPAIFLCFKEQLPKLRTIIFYLLGFLALAGYFVSIDTMRLAPPLNLAIKNLPPNAYQVLKDDISEGDRKFFGPSKISRYNFLDQTQQPIGLLSVGEIANIHNIHPAGYCLRTMRREIVSEDIENITINDREYLVTAIIFLQDGRRYLLWQYFSDDRASTGNFFSFRNHYTPRQPWTMYQIMTPENNNLPQAKARLQQLLTDLQTRPDFKIILNEKS